MITGNDHTIAGSWIARPFFRPWTRQDPLFLVIPLGLSVVRDPARLGNMGSDISTTRFKNTHD
jgi:hypothetical protein